jgi:hypothetical protein
MFPGPFHFSSFLYCKVLLTKYSGLHVFIQKLYLRRDTIHQQSCDPLITLQNQHEKHPWFTRDSNPGL